MSASYRCEHCGGYVRNVRTRRYSHEQLRATHERACPGVLIVRR